MKSEALILKDKVKRLSQVMLCCMLPGENESAFFPYYLYNTSPTIIIIMMNKRHHQTWGSGTYGKESFQKFLVGSPEIACPALFLTFLFSLSVLLRAFSFSFAQGSV